LAQFGAVAANSVIDQGLLGMLDTIPSNSFDYSQ
jgi:hypothetical protein